MAEITVHELYVLYIDTIGRCTSELRRQSDDEINYNLFEKFDVGVWSFLHESALFKLRQGGFLDEEMLAMSKEVRERWLALQNKSWTIEGIKNKAEWQELFELCDRLKLRDAERLRFRYILPGSVGLE